MAWLVGTRTREAIMVSTGLVGLRWRFLPRTLYCFDFHRIGDAGRSPYDRGVFSCTEEQFEAIVVELKRRFEMVGVGDLVDRLDRPQGPLARPLAHLTFDDGYLDNFTLAAPILDRHGVPATFFVATSYLDSLVIPWWDEIAWCVRNSPLDAIRLRGVAQPIPLTGVDREGVVLQVLRLAKKRAGTLSAESIDEIKAACGAPPVPGPAGGERLFMTWDHLRSLQGRGHAIGSHTISHQVLARLSVEQQREELAGSKRRLDAELGRPVQAVSYPVGGPGSFTADTVRIVEEAGYRIAFSYVPGFNPWPLPDRWTIRRIGVADLFSEHSLRARVGFPPPAKTPEEWQHDERLA
jgi:peptidoglycan/xylan/chitin deacetylase (PgdA/CDA1 family)